MVKPGFAVSLQDRLMAKVGPASKPVRDAKFRNFGHAAASIRKTAQQLIKRAPPEQRTRARRSRGAIVSRARQTASPPGSPVFTKRGAVRRAIAYHASEEGAVIGPRFSVVADSMEPHELGGTYKGETFPERPTMGPALEVNRRRFANSWRGSIGE